MFEQNLFIAHLYTSFGEMSPQKCELLQFSCIHKFFSFVKCPKPWIIKMGEMCIRAMWRGWWRGVRVRSHRARALSCLSLVAQLLLWLVGTSFSETSWRPASSCLTMETGRGCGQSPSECPWSLDAQISNTQFVMTWPVGHLSIYLPSIVLGSLLEIRMIIIIILYFKAVGENKMNNSLETHEIPWNWHFRGHKWGYIGTWPHSCMYISTVAASALHRRGWVVSEMSI